MMLCQMMFNYKSSNISEPLSIWYGFYLLNEHTIGKMDCDFVL